MNIMKMEKKTIFLTLTQEQEQGWRRRKLPKQWVSGTSSACAAVAEVAQLPFAERKYSPKLLRTCQPLLLRE